MGLGIDTSSMELLDMVLIGSLYGSAFTVNGGKFSQENYWIITEINPAQNIITVEAISIGDYDGMTPGFNNDDYIMDFDEMDAEFDNENYEIIMDGGGASGDGLMVI
jgi:hypothetical protein